MRTEYIFREEMKHLLAALTEHNRLACEISMATGLRIGDVVSLKTAELKRRFVVHEQKTGKNKRVYLNDDLLARSLKLGGKIYLFTHRLNGRKHRTRQAVYKDLKRAAMLFRCKSNIAPHSLRKLYAVEQYRKSGDIHKVQHLLNHDSEAVTMLYAMADQLTARRKGIDKEKVLG